MKSPLTLIKEYRMRKYLEKKKEDISYSLLFYRVEKEHIDQVIASKTKELDEVTHELYLLNGGKDEVPPSSAE